MLNLFKQHIDTDLPFLNGKKLLIAISGGLDSVVLTHLCFNSKLNVSLAHCNFNLRGDESDGDEAFVLQLAEDMELEVFVENFDTGSYAEQNKLSIQMAARELRYQWFEELANQLNFDYILTAHHADDNLETFLINLTRGTGLDGLVGIPEINGKLVRPLLPFSREQIAAYAKAEDLKWRDDSSNTSTKYLRNKIRHDVVPKLKEINPQLLQNFTKTQQHLQESKQLIDYSMDGVFDDVVDKIENGSIFFNIRKIRTLPFYKACLYELLKDFRFPEWNDVEDLLTAQTGKYVQSNTHRLLKNREQLILSPNRDFSKFETKIENSTDEITTPVGVITFKKVNKIAKNISDSVYVDKDLLKFPLTVRHWENGDYFYPFGMQGKKKLSKFFKDEKYSILEKEKVLVLCSQEKIVWVIGKRLDNRYKVTENTKNIIKISILT